MQEVMMMSESKLHVHVSMNKTFFQIKNPIQCSLINWSQKTMHDINHEDSNQGDQDDVTIEDTLTLSLFSIKGQQEQCTLIDWLMNSNDALHNIDQQEDMDQDNATRFQNDQAQDDAQY